MEESTSREKVLKKLRHALIYKTDNPFPQVNMESPIYNAMTESLDVNFAQEFTKLGGKFIYCENSFELPEVMAALCQECNWENIFCAESSLQYQLIQAGLPFSSLEEDIPGMKVAITSCEFLIARLGSIMVSSKNGRRFNIFPETHVVVASTNQLTADLPDALEAIQSKYEGRLPSLITVVSGASRTADIEKTLVKGAHGPREIYLILVESPETNDETEN
jgi:L-lactate dehydrogenase complex protein LldG